MAAEELPTLFSKLTAMEEPSRASNRKREEVKCQEVEGMHDEKDEV